MVFVSQVTLNVILLMIVEMEVMNSTAVSIGNYTYSIIYLINLGFQDLHM